VGRQSLGHVLEQWAQPHDVGVDDHPTSRRALGSGVESGDGRTVDTADLDRLGDDHVVAPHQLRHERGI
jgi:hypothetical protein